jgi:hypothetical protein
MGQHSLRRPPPPPPHTARHDRLPNEEGTNRSPLGRRSPPSGCWVFGAWSNRLEDPAGGRSGRRRHPGRLRSEAAFAGCRVSGAPAVPPLPPRRSLPVSPQRLRDDVRTAHARLAVWTLPTGYALEADTSIGGGPMGRASGLQVGWPAHLPRVGSFVVVTGRLRAGPVTTTNAISARTRGGRGRFRRQLRRRCLPDPPVGAG